MNFLILFLAFVAFVAGSPMPQGPPAPPSPTVLPIPIPSDVAAGNGLNSISESLRKASIVLNGNANHIALINANFDGKVTVKSNLSVLLFNELRLATTTLWEAALEVETKACAIASSISSQNVNAQKANLIANIQAETVALFSLQTTLVTTLGNIQNMTAAFTDAEKLVFTMALEQLLDSAAASVVPLNTLIKGLETVGVTGFWGALAGLKTSVDALANSAATANASLG